MALFKNKPRCSSQSSVPNQTTNRPQLVESFYNTVKVGIQLEESNQHSQATQHYRTALNLAKQILSIDGEWDSDRPLMTDLHFTS
ncbi:hypothetical protein P9112_014002 [Eukaryota sp. TZLM1-RC]